MATIESFNRSELKKSNPLLTKFRTTVETAFYGKNMQEVTDMAEAYELALNAAGVVVTDLPVLHAKELGLPADPDWEHVAQNIPILKFPDGTTKENATYDGAIIKQADVNLLSFPLDIVKDEASIRKDLTYYEPRMAPDGPAMGGSVLAALYGRLGDAEKAYQMFKKSYQPNQVPPFGVLAETAGGNNPYFATGAGGMLQAILAGLGGLDINDQGIVQLKTKLPKAWKSLTLKGVGVEKKTFVVK